LNSAAQRRRHAWTGLAAAFLLAIAAAVLLLRFPPDQYSFYPRCPIHTYLHLQCPGCGTTRALAALLHGRLREAFHLNALLVGAILPAAAVYTVATIASLIRLPRGSEFHWPHLPGPQRPWIYAGLALTVSFAVLRNLPR
jgi:Protein of unknown function (DUF2752)